MTAAEGRPEGGIANVSAAMLMGAAGQALERGQQRPVAGSATAREHGGDRPPEPASVQTDARVARLLDRCFSELLLVGGTPPHPMPGHAVPDVAALSAPACPLRGLVSALHAASAERVLVVAVDLLVVPAELVLALTAWPERDAVVPRTAERLQPLCAIYRRDPVLEIASARLAAGQLELCGLLEAVDTGYLEGSDLAAVDPTGAAFLDASEPLDRQRAREILTSIS